MTPRRVWQPSQPDLCQNCGVPLEGKVFSVDGDSVCLKCHKMHLKMTASNESDLAGDPYNPPPVRDMVNRPPHYNKARIECIDAMEAMASGASVEPHAAYCWQNAFKYLWRFPYKEKPIEDLKKARWYLDRLISEMER